MGKRIATVIGGRHIWEHNPLGHFIAPWYTLEIRGPLFQGKPILAYTAFDNLADAVAEAQRRGPIPDEPEISS